MKKKTFASGGYSGILICLLFFFGYGCDSKQGKSAYDTPRSGTINISVDESFEPVISEQIKVYESSYPGTKINATYKPEADCFRDLQKDSTRMIIVAKGLTTDESAFYNANYSYEPQFGILAYDAVIMIYNRRAKDSIYSFRQVRELLNGSDTSKTVVLDGNNATSTVRYLLDSVVKSNGFGKNVQAVKGSKAVVDYVAGNDNAIGFVGSSWVANGDDREQLDYQKNISFALLECSRNCDSGTYAKPSQATITYAQYPLVRPLYYILKENSNGLGSGFSNYLNLERGQLVFKRSYLVPATMYFGVRTGTLQ
ncbi:MAG TPA: substrate-binding domain-containing protein [Panacibacter sp.]|nr:substrate-binding domain-containing protein [Panacibacter sp.]HNP45866.1 substrate-binding domain-containing protein [Panacibacter sp.]